MSMYNRECCRRGHVNSVSDIDISRASRRFSVIRKPSSGKASDRNARYQLGEWNKWWREGSGTGERSGVGGTIFRRQTT